LRNRFPEEVTVFLNKNEVKFETKHQEKVIENGQEILENITLTRVIEMPFDIDLKKLSLRPCDNEGLEIAVGKPTF